jgi:hypothetical protein
MVKFNARFTHSRHAALEPAARTDCPTGTKTDLQQCNSGLQADEPHHEKTNLNICFDSTHSRGFPSTHATVWVSAARVGPPGTTPAANAIFNHG